jgi:hypothetical protein
MQKRAGQQKAKGNDDFERMQLEWAVRDAKEMLAKTAAEKAVKKAAEEGPPEDLIVLKFSIQICGVTAAKTKALNRGPFSCERIR